MNTMKMIVNSKRLAMLGVRGLERKGTLCRNFCEIVDKKKDDEAPLNFYDDQLETEKLFFDIVESLNKDKLTFENLANVKSSMSFDQLEKESNFQYRDLFTSNSDSKNESGESSSTTTTTRNRKDMTPKEIEDQRKIDKRRLESVPELLSTLSNQDVGSHISAFEQLLYVPEEMLNYNLDWRTTVKFPNQHLEPFMKKTDTELFRYDQQGNRACPGHRQRKGLNGTLYCHKIDLHALDALDCVELNRFVSTDSQILHKNKTGLCAKCQRIVAKTIKRSRHLGILPHIGGFIVGDMEENLKDGDVAGSFHKTAEGGDGNIHKSIIE